MSLFSLLHQWMTGRPQARRQTSRHPRRSFQPRLEALEERDVPSTLTVTNTQDSGAGSLRAEIAAAQSGDTITFAPSLDGQTITLTHGELLINKGLTIQGPGPGQLTISGNNASREFEVNASQPVVLSGLTLTGGYGGDGGAIFNHTALTVNDCNIIGNKASWGAGIFSVGTQYTTLTVNDSSLAGNTAAYSGGGIEYAGTLALSDSTISGNRAYKADGGGIETDGYGGHLTASGCTLDNNVAGESGGGMCLNGTVALTNCTLSGNQANGDPSQGWGNPPPLIGGGGIYLVGSPGDHLTLTDCTVTLNYAYGYGGGIAVASGATLNLISTSVYDNTTRFYDEGPNIYGTVASQS